MVVLLYYEHITHNISHTENHCITDLHHVIMIVYGKNYN